jgi:hypothetical protein
MPIAVASAHQNGVNLILDLWHRPSDSIGLIPSWTPENAGLVSPWNPDFSGGISPLSIHSHNDYKRAVPLYEALAAGCTGVEADIHLPTESGSKDLLVGHNKKSLRSDRTLQKLYTGPLVKILERLNNNSAIPSEGGSGWKGLFQESQNTTLTLLLDFKSNGADLWPYVNQQLESLRFGNWLTHWDKTSGLIWAPIIIVATGNAPFDLVIANTTYRDIFYDAPLNDISNPLYDNTNSYYASASMYHTLGQQWLWKFSSAQMSRMNEKISAATDKGLQSRYWDTPAWPVTFRDYVSGVLVDNGIGMLNLDVFSSIVYYPLITKFGQNRLVW